MGCGGPCEIEATLKRLLFFCPRQAYIVSCQLEKKRKRVDDEGARLPKT